MSAAARTGRARRGRALIVGDIPDLTQVNPTTGPTPNGAPLVVSNLFEALGEVAVSTASNPITTVLLSERALNSGAVRAAEALRKLDPAMRLVLIADGGGAASAAEWTARGFDECLAAPLAAADLARLFEDDGSAAHAASAAGSEAMKLAGPVDAAPAAQAPARATVASQPGVALDELRAKLREDVARAGPRPAPKPDPSDPTDPSNPLPPENPGPTPRPDPMPPIPRPGVTPPPLAESREAGDLGDIDLVEAVLAPDKSVRDLALRLLMEQTGWSDLIFRENTDAAGEAAAGSGGAGAHAIFTGAPRSASVDVVFNGVCYGSLSTRMAAASQLRPWAEWLARWLALDRAHRQHRLHAFQDDLTGAWNRRFFDAFLAEAIESAAAARRSVTIMVFDLDNFKSYNDEFGHAAGDEILRETVRLLNSVIRQGDRVCRIGGDEFAVIFADPEAPRTPGSKHPDSVEAIARRFQDQICQMRFPKLAEQAPGSLSISAGLAAFPWDGREPDALLARADQLSLQSKRKGKNAITFGPGAQRACGEQH